LPIAREFLEYAERDYQGSSPLYEFLAIRIAEDPDLIEIASHAKITAPNVFFAAVQFLLQEAANESLAEYYPSFAMAVRPLASIFPVFRSFCLRHREKIIDLARIIHGF
jgi:hypothetical protein